MKKLLKTVLCLFLAGLVMSCASKAAAPETKKEAPAEPVYTADSGKDMDRLWDSYFATGDETYLDELIAYVNTEDLLLKKANEQYKTLSKDQKFVTAFANMGAEQKDGKFVCDFDIEMLVAYLLQIDDFKEGTTYVYSFFPEDVFIRGVMKTTAFWSLTSNAEQYEDVNIAIQKKIPLLLDKVQVNFYSFLNLEKEIGYVHSDKGHITIESNDLLLSVILVNDINQAIYEWDNVPVDETPKIVSTTKVNSTNNSIAPFIVYQCRNQEEYPVYYDVELIDSNGKVSDQKKKIEMIENKPNNPEYMYSVRKNYYWVFDDSDKKGNYIVRVTAHTASKVIAVFDLDFVIE